MGKGFDVREHPKSSDSKGFELFQRNVKSRRPFVAAVIRHQLAVPVIQACEANKFNRYGHLEVLLTVDCRLLSLTSEMDEEDAAAGMFCRVDGLNMFLCV